MHEEEARRLSGSSPACKATFRDANPVPPLSRVNTVGSEEGCHLERHSTMEAHSGAPNVQKKYIKSKKHRRKNEHINIRKTEDKPSSNRETAVADIGIIAISKLYLWTTSLMR